VGGVHEALSGGVVDAVTVASASRATLTESHGKITSV